jgi:hypothetical protein
MIAEYFRLLPSQRQSSRKGKAQGIHDVSYQKKNYRREQMMRY